MDAKKTPSPLKSIRAYCLGCCYGSAEEVKLCPITNCELYPFRFGKNPYHTATITEEHREKLRQNAQRAVEAKRAKRNMENPSI